MKSKVRLTYERFLSYFSNKMTEKEKQTFEKSVMQDVFESDAFDGLSKLSSHELEQDFAELNASLKNSVSSKPKRKLVWLPYAASILVLVGLGLILLQINNNTSVNEFVSQDLEQTQAPKDIPSEPVASKDTLPEISEVELDSRVEKTIEEYKELAGNEKQKPELKVEHDAINVVRKPVLEKRVAKVSELEMNEKMPLAKNLAKVEKELSGQVGGVAVSNEKEKLRIRGFATLTKRKAIRNIKGHVVDENKEPLPGASIQVKGINMNVITDIDGKFEMSLLDTNSDYKLTASFIGFKPKDVDVSDSLLVVLEQDNASLNEVVVTGYDSKKISRSTESDSLEEFRQLIVQNLDYSKLQHLKGKHKVRLSLYVNADGKFSNIEFRSNTDEILMSEIELSILQQEDWYVERASELPISSTVKLKLKIEFK